MRSVVVFGGYGVFGSLVSRELAKQGIPLLIAGRNLAKAQRLAQELGPSHRGIVADALDADSCRRVVAGRTVAVHCAGPFAGQSTTLLRACLNSGCHYVDISDDRGYVRQVKEHDQPFRSRELSAVFGCSALPGISGALAHVLRRQSSEPPQAARCTLFIGNRNPKGLAAVQSLLTGLGKPIWAPQGTLRGFYDRARVSLPQPFGMRSVFNFESPEYDLFVEQLNVASVSVKVGFELRLVTFGIAGLAKLSSHWQARTARLLLPLALPFRHLGCSGGVVMTELFWANGSQTSAAIHATQQGQLMAALPCALSAAALYRRTDLRRGVMTAYELLGADQLLEDIQAAGFALTTR